MTTAKIDNPVETAPPRRSDRSAEIRVALPTGMMILGVVAPLLLFAAGWCLAALIGVFGPGKSDGGVFMSGLIGAISVAIVAFAAVFIMTPWKTRAIADWMTMWLAATGFRLLVTPVVVYLLYSAASRELAVKPLVLSVASIYFVTLLTEAVILTNHIRRSLPPA